MPPDDALGMASGLGVALAVEEAAPGAVVAVGVGEGGALGVLVARGVGVTSSALTGEGDNTRAVRTTRASEAAGYATTART
jgi:hypothetical protein